MSNKCTVRCTAVLNANLNNTFYHTCKPRVLFITPEYCCVQRTPPFKIVLATTTLPPDTFGRVCVCVCVMWYPGNMLPNLLLLHQFCIAIVNFAFPSFPVDKLLLHVVYNHTKRLSTLHLNNLVVYTTHRRRSCTTLILGRCRKDNNVATRSCNTVDRRASSLPKLVVCSMPFQTTWHCSFVFFFSLSFCLRHSFRMNLLRPPT